LLVPAIALTLLATLHSTAFAQRYSLEVKDPAEFFESQRTPLFSGPQPGGTLPPLRFTGFRGELDGQELDAIALADGKPQLLFIQDESIQGIKALLPFEGLISRILSKSDLD